MDSHPLYEWHKLCRICLKSDLLVSIFSPTFLMRPVEIIEKLNIFKPDDGLPTVLCQSCLYRLLDAYNLQQMAEASEQRLREYLNVSSSASCAFSVTTLNQDSSNFSSQHVQPSSSCSPKEADTTAAIYENFCDMFERNVQSNDVEVVADDVLNDVEIDVSSLTRSEADDTLSEVFVGTRINSGYNVEKFPDKTQNTLHENQLSFIQIKDNGSGLHSKRNAKVLKVPDKCLECGKTFRYSGYLEAHKRIHTGERPFKCKLCTRAFAQSSNLLLHQRTHTGERRFQCEVCSSFFTTSSNLKEHALTHLQHRDVHCNLCERSFKSIRELRRHEPIHKATKDIVCSICSKAFAKPNYLSAHVAAVHRGVRRHKCPECAKVFSNKSNLSCHMRTHTGEKPFQCKHCAWKFNQSSALIRHMKKHAKSLDAEKGNQEASLSNSMISNFLNASELVEVNSTITQHANYQMLHHTLSTMNGLPPIEPQMNEANLNGTDSTGSSDSTIHSYDFGKDGILDFSTNQQNQSQSLY